MKNETPTWTVTVSEGAGRTGMNVVRFTSQCVAYPHIKRMATVTWRPSRNAYRVRMYLSTGGSLTYHVDREDRAKLLALSFVNDLGCNNIWATAAKAHKVTK